MQFGFIGMGAMGFALLQALLGGRLISPRQVIASDRKVALRQRGERELGIITSSSNLKVVEWADILFLCIKPQDFVKVRKEIFAKVKGKIIVSIAAGVTIANLEEFFQTKVIRLMPNAPCVIGRMAGAYAIGKGVSAEDLAKVVPLFKSAGVVLEVEEHLMDTVTALAGCGPAYIAYIIQAFAHAGEKCGLNSAESFDLTLETFLGTVEMLKSKIVDPKLLIKQTSSPQGCTREGRKVLESSPLKEIILKTLQAAVERSQELSKIPLQLRQH